MESRASNGVSRGMTERARKPQDRPTIEDIQAFTEAVNAATLMAKAAAEIDAVAVQLGQNVRVDLAEIYRRSDLPLDSDGQLDTDALAERYYIPLLPR